MLLVRQQERHPACRKLSDGCWRDYLSGVEFHMAQLMPLPLTISFSSKSRLILPFGRRLGHYGDHPRPRVADRGTPSRVDKRVAPDTEGAADKQCQGEGKLWSQYVIANCEEGKGKPPRLFPKTGYTLGYPEPALQQKTEERVSAHRGSPSPSPVIDNI